MPNSNCYGYRCMWKERPKWMLEAVEDCYFGSSTHTVLLAWAAHSAIKFSNIHCAEFLILAFECQRCPTSKNFASRIFLFFS